MSNPLLSKPELDVDDLKNYRPVSNLPYLSKGTERVVASRLADHVAEFDLHDPHQSAFRPYHSCETALIHVQNEILRAMDNQKVGNLLLWHLSAAFDAESHEILLIKSPGDCSWYG